MKIFFLAFASLALLCVPARSEVWTLSRYMDAVFKASDEVRTAEEEVELAENSYISSLAAFYLPDVVLSASNSPYSVYNVPKWQFRNGNTSAGASANLNLFNNFKDKLGLDSSALDRTASESKLWQVRQRVTLDSLNTYYNVLRRKLLLAVVRSSLKSYEEQYAKVQEYYKEGLKSYSDVLKSELSYRSSQLSEATSSESYKNAVMQFNFSIYRDPETDIELEDEVAFSTASLPALGEGLAYAAKNRVELRLAENQLRHQDLARTGALIGWLPDLSLDAAYNRQGLGNLGKLASLTTNPTYSLTLSLSLPLGPATFSDRKNYLSAEIGRERALRAVRDLRLQIKKEVISAYLAFTTTLKRYEVSKMKADISKQSLAIVAARYGEGRAGIIDLADAQSDDLSSQSDLANALYDLLLARASYDSAVGRQLWN